MTRVGRAADGGSLVGTPVGPTIGATDRGTPSECPLDGGASDGILEGTTGVSEGTTVAGASADGMDVSGGTTVVRSADDGVDETVGFSDRPGDSSNGGQRMVTQSE
jgi:hypothetical protein